tara:strand:+ start:576 stop:746 length:171 start_codon:yes stop_codon:yes gene_type:complete
MVGAGDGITNVSEAAVMPFILMIVVTVPSSYTVVIVNAAANISASEVASVVISSSV